MKTWNIYYVAIIIATTFFVMACNKARGPIVEQQLNVASFKGIDLKIRDNVYIKQGPTQSVKVEAQENVAEAINKSVVNGIWTIDFTEMPKLYKNMKIYITTPDLKSITLSGPGIIITERMTLDSLTLNVNGTGNIDVEGTIANLFSNMNTAGDIFLEGNADNHQIKIPGTGKVNSFDMQSKQCDINIDGVGTANVKVQEKLKAIILGDGVINYKGNPILETTVAAGGIINKVD